MKISKSIKSGSTVKLISGHQKGTTGKVLKVITKQNAVLIEGIGLRHRHVKANQLNPRGGSKDIHVPTPLCKVALVTDKKMTKGGK